MEIRALSNSTLNVGQQYLRSRLLRSRIVALWALLVAARTVAAPPERLAELIEPAVFLAVATALLRLWDDLADLGYDRVRHPERVLVVAAEVRPFVTVAVAGLISLIVALAHDERRLITYLALLAWLALLYHGPVSERLARSLRVGWVLVKYPVLVFLAGAGPSFRGCLVAVGLYAGLLIYEWSGDPDVGSGPVGQLLVAASVGAALVALVYLAPGRA
jgi:hypothetical protein